ncbi:MAG: TetR/AcrR family transcriptional regulator [Lachnospiraceae bacterium]|nr:TetR/AcrR family transcriptional regulator [Lachnospiraceae bacterium]MBQ6995679.1 TetR/AcrR family transcriptional regulator [Lachnospiraceae bacterium]
MAFSKGKRIEDETSKRIIDLAVNIGCKEGPDALTVTRICKELNCDRRVIYNRFRDLDEINMLVANRCNEELIAKAKEAVKEGESYFDNFKALMKEALTYIYERNAFFQYYTALYKVTEEGVRNEILQYLTELIENGKKDGDVSSETDCREAAESMWVLITGISGMLATNVNYKYQDGLKAMMYGVNAISAYMKP